MKKYLILVLLLLIPLPVFATSRIADSCSYTDVKAKYDLSSAEDTIVIPACNSGETWSTGLAVTIPISIIGNGSAGSNKTKLIAHSTLNAGIIQINVTSTSLVRVSGIYFDLVTTPGTDRIAIKIGGSITQAQIDNNFFYGGKYQIYKTGRVFGVIYANNFYEANSSIELDGDNNTSWADTWNAGMDRGLNTLYIEGNTFLRTVCADGYQNHIESSQGGPFVVRYNTFDGTGMCYNECHPYGDSCYFDYHFMSHGNNPCLADAGARSPSLIEIYNNLSNTNRGYSFVFRGGSILMHDNVLTYDSSGLSDNPIVLWEEEATGVFPNCPKIVWPAEDQVFNSFFWNNTLNGSGATIGITTGGYSIIVEDQDYFTHAPAATGGKETLYDNGTTKFTFYDASHKMSFSGSGANAYYPYTPYTCPHPLAGAGSCTSTAGMAGYILGGTNPTSTGIITGKF